MTPLQGAKPGTYSRTYAVGGAPAQPAAHADGPPRPLLQRGTATASLTALGAPNAAGGDNSRKGPVPGRKGRGEISSRGGGRGARGRGRGRGKQGDAGASSVEEDSAVLQARLEAQALEAQALEAQARLPGPEWRERYGAAGVPAGERRSSPIVEISLLLAECVQHGLRAIAFCHTRKLCELVIAYTRETLRSTAPKLAPAIAVYRAGYSPKARRRARRALFRLMGGGLRTHQLPCCSHRRAARG